MATPILSDLRQAFPRAHITAMCRSPICELLKEDQTIDELFCFRKSESFSRRDERRNIIQKLKMGKFDLGVLLTHSFSSAWWFWAGRVRYRLGYASNGRKLLLTHSFDFPLHIHNQHLVTTYKTLLQPLAIKISTTPPRLYLSDEEIEHARVLLFQRGVIPNASVLIGINPGATYGSAKCWLPERFREVTQRLLQDSDCYIVYFGDQATRLLCEEICRELPSRVINLAGQTTLRELAGLISLCDVLLTNDSGPMHIADALGTPLVALFGSTSEIVTGPYSQKGVIHKHEKCSPCYQRVCPIDFPCMRRIQADEVYCAVKKTLSK